MNESRKCRLVSFVCVVVMVLTAVFWGFVVDPVGSIEETQQDGECGDPVTESTRVACGIVTQVEDNTVTIVDEQGEAWTAEVGDPSLFSPDYYYCMFFDTKNTEDIYDDEIVKMWREVW